VFDNATKKQQLSYTTVCTSKENYMLHNITKEGHQVM